MKNLRLAVKSIYYFDYETLRYKKFHINKTLWIFLILVFIVCVFFLGFLIKPEKTIIVYKEAAKNLTGEEEVKEINITACYIEALTDLKTIQENTLAIKSHLKSKGISKKQAAAIIGNIHKETGGSFNTGIMARESSGYYSIGLFQLNTKYNALGGFDELGYTVEEQIDFVFDNNINNIIEWINSSIDFNLDQMTYSFAKDFERCYNCVKGKDVYIEYEYSRTIEARKFYKRFNNSNDILFWENEISIKN